MSQRCTLATTLNTLDKFGAAAPTNGAWLVVNLPRGAKHALIRVPLSSSYGVYLDSFGAGYTDAASRNAGEGAELGIGESMTLDLPPSDEARAIYLAGNEGTASVEVLPSSVRLSR